MTGRPRMGFVFGWRLGRRTARGIRRGLIHWPYHDAMCRALHDETLAAHLGFHAAIVLAGVSRA